MKPKILRLFLLLCLIPVLVVAAFVIPMFTSVPEIPPGLSREEELVAEFALNQARQFYGGSLAPLMITGMKVISIQKKPGKTKIYLPKNPNKPEGTVYYTFQNAYNVKVKVYTFFGFTGSILVLNLREGGMNEITSY